MGPEIGPGDRPDHAAADLGSDAAIGVITTASFAFGIALLGIYSRVKRSIEATVFGSVLGVSTSDVVVVVAVAALTAIVVVFFYRQLLFTTLTPRSLRSRGSTCAASMPS